MIYLHTPKKPAEINVLGQDFGRSCKLKPGLGQVSTQQNIKKTGWQKYGLSLHDLPPSPFCRKKRFLQNMV